MTNRPEVVLDSALPSELFVGSGHIQVITGSVSWRDHEVSNMDVLQPSDRDCSVELFSQEGAVTFFIQLPWFASDDGELVPIELKLSDLDNNSSVIRLGSEKIKAGFANPDTTVFPQGSQPLVAICMAAYSPKVESFSRQLDSILGQSYENWVLLISDDASKNMDWAQIEGLCKVDMRRIKLLSHDENLGFYHNFERALSYVPNQAEYIAFSDQDDIWYPDKLQKLVDKIQAEQVSLVYSDMRIVHESGKVISETYWQGRKNEFRDFDTVFMANTVTGAALLFKREMLEVILPFPDKVGDAFHDHWLACAALSMDKIAYVDEALYDYMQYGDSVIGHCDFKRWSAMQRMQSIGRLALRFLRPKSAKIWLGQKIGGGIAIYRGECLRLQVMSRTLTLRLKNENKPSTLTLMNGGLRSTLKLLILHVKILLTGRTTDDAEFRLAMGFAAREVQKIRK